MCFQNKNAKREEKVIMRDFKDLKIAVAGTGLDWKCRKWKTERKL